MTPHLNRLAFEPSQRDGFIERSQHKVYADMLKIIPKLFLLHVLLNYLELKIREGIRIIKKILVLIQRVHTLWPSFEPSQLTILMKGSQHSLWRNMENYH